MYQSSDLSFSTDIRTNLHFPSTLLLPGFGYKPIKAWCRHLFPKSMELNARHSLNISKILFSLAHVNILAYSSKHQHILGLGHIYTSSYQEVALMERCPVVLFYVHWQKVACHKSVVRLSTSTYSIFCASMGGITVQIREGDASVQILISKGNWMYVLGHVNETSKMANHRVGGPGPKDKLREPPTQLLIPNVPPVFTVVKHTIDFQLLLFYNSHSTLMNSFFFCFFSQSLCISQETIRLRSANNDSPILGRFVQEVSSAIFRQNSTAKK